MSVLASIGLLFIRVVIGVSFAAHGTQKLFGWFGGHGLKATGGFFDSIGIKPGYTMALLAGLAEFAGGLLFAFGLFTPVAGILIAITMIGAIVKVHGQNGFWATEGGYEYNLMLLVIGIGFVFTGGGLYSLDALLF
ncbi:putative oxidoreductase [Salibacterium salarium]|uniref:DoxX family protein n=1 Tax=Salibacterium salarium TaxID=284579 RepID=A0A428MWZ8_9BACI|nr:DoxX family protein [Salibacterium salarium]MDQ0297747.1 putative oxidoreductase [Salibacterium salarium]RSL30614.1 DoxX family protein [Salibacterium salarium]